MGVLRKLVSGRLQAQAAGPHPDPDVLAAFAENALLQAERAHLLQHLGACHDCREILYLAAPESEAAQKVLSYQPKSRPWMMFRWGTLAASVVIVGVAVTARHSLLEKSTLSSQSREAATAPVSPSPQMAQEKALADVESARDRLGPAPQPVAKERPELKHMTAKPQASMQFDDSDQVRVSPGLVADQAKKSRNDEVSSNGRSVAGLSAPSNQPAAAPPPIATGALAKDQKKDVMGGSANLYATSAEKPAIGNLDGKIVDSSGAAVGNAKVTTVGPIGEKTATSDSKGRFVFSSLTPGTYAIKAEASGFKSGEIRQVAVLENKTSTVGVKMEPGNSSEAVEVTGAAVGANEVSTLARQVTTQEIIMARKQVAQLEAKKAVAANSPQRAKASSTAMPSPQWTLSSDGVVQRSTDLGKTWQKVSTGEQVVFRSLCALGTHVWAGGNAGTLVHSTDSGQTWARVNPSMIDEKLTANITHVEFIDPANGSVSTSNGEVWTTSDGGQTWRRK